MTARAEAGPRGAIARGRDVRMGGRWSRGQRAKNAAIHAAIRVAIALLARLPPGVARALGRGAGAIAHAALRGARRTARANVARALPALDPAARRAIVRGAYRALGGHLGDAVASLHPGREAALLPFPDADRRALDEARAEGRGVVFVSAHLGPWERVAATLVAAGVPLTTIARESYDPRLTSLYDRLRGGRGVRSIYRGDPRAPVQIVRTLRRGGVLGAPMDLKSRVASAVVDFLGAPASTPIGPARIALRTGAAVVVGTVAPSPSGLVLAIRRISTSDITPGDVVELTARLNRELSARILALPSEWVWMHDRW